MGIFDKPKRLANLLASVKVHTTDRPLKPVEVSEWIREAIEELGDKKEVMKRLDLGDSMMNAFENLITKVSEDWRHTAVWGKTDVKKYQYNFTALHLMSSLDVEDQNRLFTACSESTQEGITFPTKEELKRIRQHYNENKPNKTIDDAISYILKIDRPPAGFTSSVLIASLNEDVFERLQKEAEKRNLTSKEAALQVLNEELGGSIQGVKVMETGIIRILFSKEGKNKFDEIIASKKIKKNQLVNDIIGGGL